MQDLIEAEVTARIGAGRYERNPERVTRRNGTREKKLATPSGTLELQIPKLRSIISRRNGCACTQQATARRTPS